MSKASRRPSQKAIKALRKERKKAQQELRQRQKAQGLCAPPSSTLSNGKSLGRRNLGKFTP